MTKQLGLPDKPKYLFFLLTLTALLILPHRADANVFKIIKISPEGGYSFDAINTICEDKFGFIWFGSNSGVYRYNTINTVNYINSPENKFSLPGNSVRSIYCDRKNILWIATNNGICSFDNQMKHFIRYQFHDASGNARGVNVSRIFQTADSTYWMVDNYGIARIDFKKNLLTYLQIPDNTKNDQIRFAYVNSKDDRIWMGGQSGGIFFSDSTHEKINFFARERPENVTAIFPDGDKLWVGYDWGGADLFSSSGLLTEHYSDDVQARNRIPSSKVNSIIRYKNEIWLGTFKGLVRIKPEGIEVIGNETYTGLQNKSIFEFYKDSKNGLWIGTWSGGLSYISEWSNNFEHYKRTSFENSLSDNGVSDFEETKDGKIIISTEEGKLNYLDQRNNHFSFSRIKDQNSYVDHIKSLHLDVFGTLWVGTYGLGIFLNSPGSGDFRRFDLIDANRELFTDIISDRDGVWFASSSSGLFCYNYQNRQIKRYTLKNSDAESLSSNIVKSLLFDSKGNLWVGTANGLNMKSKDSEKFRRFFFNQDTTNLIGNKVMISLQEDAKHNIWIGTTGEGVIIYDPNVKTFTNLSKKDGLAGNDVYGILEDDAGVIWMSTENGISAWSPIRREIRNFDYSDGLQGNQFNPGAAFKAKNGMLFFGGSNGFNRFDPRAIKENPIVPTAYITGLEINNKKTSHVSDPDLIKRSLMTMDRLELNYNQNSLKFEFAANNFLLPQKNKFKYRLKGYSPKWVEMERENKAVFTKIPPGKYMLEVKASNNDGKWNNVPTKTQIIIKKPFWSTGYAMIFYIILVFTLSYLLQRELRIRNRLKNSILQERLQRENEKKLHQLKLLFFTNISHEFRTPLTLILAPLSALKKKIEGQEKPVEHLNMIEHNANRLLRLVNQILDFRTIELGKVSFQPQSFDLVPLCREVFQCFSLQANDFRIKFVFESDFSSLHMTIDHDKIDKLVFNLLSNAIKYSIPDGTILLSIKAPGWQGATPKEPLHYLVGEKITGEYVTIIVKNDGAGIAPVDLPHIFDRFYKSNDQASGTGIGLHLCSEYIRMHNGLIEVYTGKDMGATFYVRIPVIESIPGKGVHEAISGTVIYEERDNLSVPQPSIPKIPAKEIKILVVEDNSQMQKILIDILSEYYHIITADNATEGLRLVGESDPDLILTDIMMPGMNGNEFCQILKNDLNTSHIPVIILTSLSSVESQLESFETGADDYVVKPFDDRVLLMRIRKLLDFRTILREKFTKAHGEWNEEMQQLRPDKELLDLAVAIIDQHIVDLNFTVDVLASKLNLSRSSLHRKLKSLTNQSATEFIKFVRINKSIRLIESGETNIDEICFKVGFNSHSYFSMCFKKQLGLSPSEYISRNKRESIKEHLR